MVAGKSFCGHHGSGENDRNHSFLALQSQLDLETNEVVGIVQTSVTLPICRSEPTRPDQNEQDVGRGDSLADGLEEIVARLKTVGVAKHAVPSQRLDEPITQPSGIASTVVAPGPAGTTVVVPPGSTVTVTPPPSALPAVALQPWCAGTYAAGGGTNFGGCPGNIPR